MPQTWYMQAEASNMPDPSVLNTVAVNALAVDACSGLLVLYAWI